MEVSSETSDCVDVCLMCIVWMCALCVLCRCVPYVYCVDVLAYMCHDPAGPQGQR